MAASGAPADSGSGDDVSTLSKIPADPANVKEDARRTIAITLVWAYLGVIAVNAIIPVALLLWAGSSASSTELSSVRDFIAPVTALTGSVTGVIGFVLGYYFKTEEVQRKKK